MKKLLLLLLFSLIHLVPTNIQPMEENKKKKTIYEFFGIKEQKSLSLLSSDVKNVIAQEIIGPGGWWYPHTIYEHPTKVTLVKYNKNGRLVATVSYNNNIVRLWDDYYFTHFPHKCEVRSIALSHNGKFISTASGSVAKLWDLKDKDKSATVFPHENWVNSVKFSHDDQFVLTALQDGTSVLWDIKGKKLVTFDHGKVDVRQAKFSHDDKFVLTVSRNNDGTCTVVLWNYALDTNDRMAAKEIERIRYENTVNLIKFSPNDKLIAIASYDFNVKLYNLMDEKLEEIAVFKHGNVVTSVDFSPIDELIATASGDFTAKLWNYLTGEEIAVFKHGGKVNSIKFSPSGKLIATASHDNAVVLWNLKADKLATLVHQLNVGSLKFINDELIFTGSDDKTAVLWKKYKLIGNCALEQVLLGKLLRRFVQSPEREPVKNIEQINTFFEHVAEAFNLDSKELISIWGTFSKEMRRAILHTISVKEATNVNKSEYYLPTYSSLCCPKWDCNYDVVIVPKCSKKPFYVENKKLLCKVFHGLLLQKEIELLKTNVCDDYVHMLISISPKYSVAKIIESIKLKSAAKVSESLVGGQRKINIKQFWQEGYLAKTFSKVGFTKSVIKDFVQNRNQLDSYGHDRVTVKFNNE